MVTLTYKLLLNPQWRSHSSSRNVQLCNGIMAAARWIPKWRLVLCTRQILLKTATQKLPDDHFRQHITMESTLFCRLSQYPLSQSQADGVGVLRPLVQQRAVR